MRNTTTQNQDGLTIISNEEDVKTYLGKDDALETTTEPSAKRAKPISKAEERRRKKAEKEARDKEVEDMLHDFLNKQEEVTYQDGFASNPQQSHKSKRTIVTLMTETDEKSGNSEAHGNTASSGNSDTETTCSSALNQDNDTSLPSQSEEDATVDSAPLCSLDSPRSDENPIIVDIVTIPTTTTEVTIAEESEPPQQVPNSSKESSTPKATRISAKMRRASREEFCDTYLKKCDTKFGKPITIEAPLMPRLYRIFLLTGDRKACPTSLINNIIKEILPTLEKDAERW